MPKMIKELEAHPEYGFLGATQGLWATGPSLVQYWRSFEDLERFARAPGERHAEVWRAWYRTGQHENSAAGIWHESFAVSAGRYEAVYQGTPVMGLLKAGRPERIGSRSLTARDRLGAGDQPETAPLPVPRGTSEDDPLTAG
jgi:hypothetical protein